MQNDVDRPTINEKKRRDKKSDMGAKIRHLIRVLYF